MHRSGVDRIHVLSLAFIATRSWSTMLCHESTVSRGAPLGTRRFCRKDLAWW
jgi:hypothetical protein